MPSFVSFGSALLSVISSISFAAKAKSSRPNKLRFMYNVRRTLVLYAATERESIRYFQYSSTFFSTERCQSTL